MQHNNLFWGFVTQRTKYGDVGITFLLCEKL